SFRYEMYAKIVIVLSSKHLRCLELPDIINVSINKDLEIKPTKQSNQSTLLSCPIRQFSLTIPNSLVTSNEVNGSLKYSTDRCGNSDSPRSPNPGFWKSVIDVTRNPIFYVLLLSAAIFYAVEYVVFTTIVDYAVDNGTDESTALWLTPWYLLTCSIGRVCLPLLADKGLLPRNVLLTLCLLLMATSLLVLPYAVDFWMIVVVCTCMAACYGSTYVMHDVLLVDYFGVEQLVALYGIMGFAKTPLLLLTPSFI
ncbi:monocarboxylate transporter, putative, partial [Ixodes scapularis]